MLLLRVVLMVRDRVRYIGTEYFCDIGETVNEKKSMVSPKVTFCEVALQTFVS